MNKSRRCYEPLFLSKKKNHEVVIDRGHIPQHQVDGIRYLFQQFVKKKPGVIFNDPPGYGTDLQIVLFINALKYVLHNKPVLILCNEDDVGQWIKHFQERIELHHDVTIENTNPYGDHMVYINSMKKLSTFCRREWSVVVADNTDTKYMQQVKADFKIYITPLDMKSNLQLFSTIYLWITSPNDFIIETIKELNISKTDSVKTALNKTVLLDSLLKDIVIRRNNLDESLSPKLQNITEKTACEYHEKEMPKLSIKNKDSTGTKIKRTKRKLVDENNDLISKDHCSKICENQSVAINNNIFLITNKSTPEKYDNDADVLVNEAHDRKTVTTNAGIQINSNGPHPQHFEIITSNIPNEHSNVSHPVDRKMVTNNIINEHSNGIHWQGRETLINNVIDGHSNSSDSHKKETTTNKLDISNTLSNVIKTNNKLNESKNITDFDAKFSELEKKALKKFKGSFLDSIF